MKIYIIPLVLLLVFAFSGCDNYDFPANDEIEDIYDLEWNKDMDIEENTMFYIDNEGSERTINIANTYVSFFPYYATHTIDMKKNVTNEQLVFQWGYEEEIKVGNVELIPYAYIIDHEKKIEVALRGMLNIIEVSNDEVIPDTDDERKITIKAIFHIKKESYYYQEIPGGRKKIKSIETKESKGIFYYSGIEYIAWIGGL